MEKLPPELILKIAENLMDRSTAKRTYLDMNKEAAKDAIDLNHLALTCQTLYNSVNPELYRSIFVDTARLRALLRTAVKNPSLASLIRQIVFCWSPYCGIDAAWEFSKQYMASPPGKPINWWIHLPVRTSPKPSLADLILFERAATKCWLAASQSSYTFEKGSADAETVLLLETTPRLQKLEIALGVDLSAPMQHHPYDNPPLPSYPLLRAYLFGTSHASRTQPISQLESLLLSNDEHWTVQLTPYMIFPGLRKLTMHSYKSHRDPRMRARSFPDLAFVQLEEMTLTWSALHAEDLQRLLQCPRALKHFAYQTTSSDLLFLEGLFEPEYTNPNLLLSGLSRHKDSLESLLFLSVQGERFWLTDDTENLHEGFLETSEQDIADFKARHLQPVDLRDFSVLRDITIHVTDILGLMDRETPRVPSALWLNLPSHVTSLALDFNDIFKDRYPQLQPQLFDGDADRENESGIPAVSHDWYCQYYGNILDLLSLKAEHFRSLVSLTFDLEDSWPRPPQEIYDLAVKVGVKIEVKDSWVSFLPGFVHTGSR